MKKSELKLLIKSIVTEIYSSKRESLGESEALSGFEKTSDKAENTEMGLDDKKLTITTEPKEKEEGKKLPVVKKPATPKIVKEDILGMIREALEQQRVEEMAKRPSKFDAATGILDASVSPDRRKSDPTSPTGYRLVGAFELKDPATKKVTQVVPDGTPIMAPSAQTQKKLGAVSPTTPPSTVAGSGSSILSPQTVAAQTPASSSPDDGAEDEDLGAEVLPQGKPNSKVKVTLDGKPIGQFDFRLPSGKISSDNMETNLYRTELPTLPLDKSVSSKYEQIENMFFDDKLPANTTLNLFTAKNATGKTIVAK